MTKAIHLHHVPGRLRIRSRSLCGISKSTNLVLRKLRALKGVQDCRLNSKAACVTVYYDIEVISVDTILNLLKEQGFANSGSSGIRKVGLPVSDPVKSGNLTSLVGKTALNVLINKGVSYSISSLLGARI